MGAETSVAQILDRATLSLAYHWKATADKAAMIADFLGVKSINDPLFVAMEDAVEARFHELVVADNRPFQVGDIVLTPALGCWSEGKIVSIEGGYLHCTDPKHGGEFCVHSNRVRKIRA
jgi:hypothetical protein